MRRILRGRRERATKEKGGEEGGREVVRKWMEKNEVKVVRRRRERASDEDETKEEEK